MKAAEIRRGQGLPIRKDFESQAELVDSVLQKEESHGKSPSRKMS